jgi:hypothetical protein
MEELSRYFTQYCWKSLMFLWTLSHLLVTSLKGPYKGRENQEGTSPALDGNRFLNSAAKPKMKLHQKRSSKTTSFGLKALASAYIELKMEAIRENIHSKVARHSRKFNFIRL